MTAAFITGACIPRWLVGRTRARLWRRRRGIECMRSRIRAPGVPWGSDILAGGSPGSVRARCRGSRSWMGCIRSGMTSRRRGSVRLCTRRSERTLASSTPMELLLPAKARRGTVVTTKPVRFLSLAIGLHQIDARRSQSCSRRERAISRAHPYYGNALPSYRRVAYAALLGNFFDRQRNGSVF